MNSHISPGTENSTNRFVRRTALSAFLVGFIIALVLLSIYNVLADSYKVTFQGTYSFHVRIMADEERPYVLLVPSVIDSDGAVNPELMGRLRTAGNCTTTVVTTEKGPFLGISGRGNVQIWSKTEFDTGKGDSIRGRFSPRLSSVHNQSSSGRTFSGWVNLSGDSDISMLHIRVELVCSEAGSFYNGLGQGGPNWGHVINNTIAGSLSKGWKELPGTGQRIEWDAFVGWGFYTPFSSLFILSVSGINGSTAAMWYLTRFRKKNPAIDLKGKLEIIFPRLAAILAVISIIELFFASFSNIIYLGSPSVMNVFQVSDVNNVVTIIMVYCATAYPLLLQTMHQAGMGKRRAVWLCGGFGAWLSAGFFLWLSLEEEPFHLLAIIILAMGLLAILSVIIHLKTTRPEMRQIEEQKRYVSSKRITWAHFGEFLGDTGYFIRLGDDTYKLSAEKAFGFSEGELVTVETDGTGSVRSIGGIAPIKWP